MKTKNTIAYHVKVEVECYRAMRRDGETQQDADLRAQKRTADEVVRNIKRHVDDVLHVYTEMETEVVCSHCGAEWTEKSNSYNGGCCDADEAGKEAENV